MGLFDDLARAALRPVMRRAFEWTVEGDHHIPEGGGVLLAANHISYLDGLCLAYVADLRGRRARFLVKASFFKNPVLGPVLRGFGDIPAGRRGGAATGSGLDAAVEGLVSGHCLGIFPEGRISPDLEPQEARTGVARIAGAAGVPVVPVGLWGSHRVWEGGWMPRPPLRVAEVVVVGPPLRVEPDEDPHEATDRIMAAICSQLAQARRLYPERPAPGQPDWWHRQPDTARVRSCRNLADDEELWPPDRERPPSGRR